MTIGYQKVLNLPEGYVTQQPLSPIFRNFNINNEILGTLGELTLFEVADMVTRTFRLPIATRPGQQCAVKSINANASGIVNVVGSFDYDNGYQQILFAGQNGSTVNTFRLETYSGESAIFVSGVNTTNPTRLSWYLAAYYIGAKPPENNPFRWVWPNAAARLAQVATVGDIGGIGFQTDIAREFRLLALTGGAPLRWGRVPASDVELWRQIMANCNEQTKYTLGWTFTQGGASTVVVPSSTNAATRLIRVHHPTGNVGPDLVSTLYANNGLGAPLTGGWRYFFEFALMQLDSATCRWFVGLGATAPTLNVDFANSLNIFGIGRNNSQANVQFLRNDGAGVATLADLGANFPANVAQTAFQLELYFPPDNSTGAFNLKNKNNSAEVSGVFNTEIPVSTVQMQWQTYITNNTIGNQCVMGFGYVRGGQLAY